MGVHILATRVRPDLLEGILIWQENKKWNVTGKGAYIADQKRRFQDKDGWWTNLCFQDKDERIKILIWMISQKSLPTLNQLVRRKITDDDLCSLCSSSRESCLHIFWACPFARAVWFSSPKLSGILQTVPTDVKEILT